MKLITLNTWGGRINKELLDFITSHQEVDIFCFQEIYHRATYIHVEQGGIDPDLNLFDNMKKALLNHQGYFRPAYLGTYGLAVFVKKGIVVTEEEDFFVHEYKGFVPKVASGHARNVQSVSIKSEDEILHVFNFHGLWNGEGKGDSDSRLRQSRNLSMYMKKFKGKKVLCGDFNLLPDTESMKTIEETPLKNLIKEHNIVSTRTSYYTKEARLADYVLISNDVEIIDFKVLDDEVSDHSPLFLEFK